ncbi:MAG: hypothetical protein IPP48_08370 [Chitinophagaceae bacterium]|nr:hypothetical protein [Chitinophagaceae bacterium]
MKFLIFIYPLFISIATFAQIPKSGTYIYKFCDAEYNACLHKCKIKIKENKIWVYAPAGLSHIKEGELFESGTIVQAPSKKWLILHTKTNKAHNSKIYYDQPSWIDFKKKQFWQF